MQIREINEHLLDSYSDDIPSFIKKILAARNVSETRLDLTLSKLLHPKFTDLEKAILLLEDCLINDKKILIVGDFDCDGATASAVAMKSLRMMGCKFVDFLVPNRFEHGYGLSKEIVKLAKEEKEPDLIITVDNGIASNEGVEFAKSLDISVIITDHHLPPDDLPKADAIINPNLKDCDFDSKNLAGVGVSFYLFSALRTHLINQNYFEKNNIEVPDLRNLLDLVALGTVADVVKLDQNNRILISEGLKNIRQNNCSPGIKALIEISNRKQAELTAQDIGFSIAPKLNAAGRLSDISIGIKCLMTHDLGSARRFASELESYNKKRRETQDQMQNEALQIVEKFEGDEHFAVCLYEPNWHEGIVGIVAGKIKEKLQCPVAVFAKAQNKLKGSIRSIPSVHIKDLLDLIDQKNPGVIDKFGGHAMAAGLTIKEENFEKFQELFASFIQSHLDNKKPAVELMTDGDLKEHEMSLSNALLLESYAPWGQGFEEPIFKGLFEILDQKIVGEKHLKCSLRLKGGSLVFQSIAFFQNRCSTKFVEIAYKLSINRFRGQKELQLMIEQIQPLEKVK